MEIIKHGQMPTKKEHELICHVCTTVFRFKQKEATFHTDWRDGDYFSIGCPVCGQKCTFTE